MNVRLKPEDMELIRQKVEAGYYSDETEMVSQALALQEQVRVEKLEALEAALEDGMTDVRAGRVVSVRTKDDMDKLFAKRCG